MLSQTNLETTWMDEISRFISSEELSSVMKTDTLFADFELLNEGQCNYPRLADGGSSTTCCATGTCDIST